MPPSTRSPGGAPSWRVVGQDAAEGHLERPAERRGRRRRRPPRSPPRAPAGRRTRRPGRARRCSGRRRASPSARTSPQDPRHHVVDVGARARRARQDRVEGRRGAAEVQDAEGHEVTRLPAGSRPLPACAGVAPSRPDRPSSGDVLRRRDLLPLLHPGRTARAGHRPGRERAGQRRRGHGARAHRGRALPRRGAASPPALPARRLQPGRVGARAGQRQRGPR